MCRNSPCHSTGAVPCVVAGFCFVPAGCPASLTSWQLPRGCDILVHGPLFTSLQFRKSQCSLLSPRVPQPKGFLWENSNIRAMAEFAKC